MTWKLDLRRGAFHRAAPFVCEACGERFLTAPDLAQHVAAARRLEAEQAAGRE